MLRCPQRAQEVTPTPPPTNTYASAPLPFTIFMLLRRPQDMPPMLPSTLLILSAAYHPYALVVSSRHATNTAPTPS
ncbi:hypothetical protein O181_013339 [Austropuccinia psidii MF-1]|uniref:Uncharacterized protein n=1 Tax=Austropuccinia psidii MF-1 TaxID=1389203 RepID=A0A9Q3BW84_9BASI|nr:hypothetical protein [Austropuccinia psidii MF-1]